MNRQIVSKGGLALVKKPVRRVETTAFETLREASTGSAVVVLPRVWAVGVEAKTSGAADVEPRRATSPLRVVQAQKVAAVGEEMPGFPAGFCVMDAATEPEAFDDAARPESKPELAFYRKYTEAMLRRYQRMSMANGRVPSLLGRELFRGSVTHYSVSGFDDVVIFCLDVKRCLKRLTPGEMAMVRRIGVQEYSQEEAGALLGKTARHIRRTYGLALDKLTEAFLEKGLMEPLKSCQGGQEVSVGVSL